MTGELKRLMRSPIEVAIDQACGVTSDGKATWEYDLARQVLIELADEMVRWSRERCRTSVHGWADAEASVALQRAADLYFDARMAVGIRSEVAFQRRVKMALRHLEAELNVPRRGVGKQGEIRTWVDRARRRMGYSS